MHSHTSLAAVVRLSSQAHKRLLVFTSECRIIAILGRMQSVFLVASTSLQYTVFP